MRKKNNGQEYGTMLSMIHDTVDEEEGRQMEAEWVDAKELEWTGHLSE